MLSDQTASNTLYCTVQKWVCLFLCGLMNFLYANPKHMLQAESNLTGFRLTCHFVTCHIMWFSGRLQQREDLQPSSNESTQSDLYERLVYT